MENYKEVKFEAEWCKNSAKLDFEDRYKYSPDSKELEEFIEFNLKGRIIFDMVDSNLFEVERINDDNNNKMIFKCFIKSN